MNEFSDALAAHEFLSNEGDSIQLVFLDIEMPGLNGLDYLRSLPPTSSVILTTAYPQYALEAFELDVADYLLKPIKLDRFMKAVERVKLLNEGDVAVLSYESAENFVYIKSDRKFFRVYLKDILFIKGLKDYVIIYTKEKKYITAMNVKTIGKQLPKSNLCPCQ